MLLPLYSREEIRRKIIFILNGSVFFQGSQKRVLRRSLRRVANFFICLNTNLIFWIYCTPKTLRCRKGRMQDLWDVGKEVCRKGGMHEKRDTGKEGSRKEGISTGGIQKRWDLGL